MRWISRVLVSLTLLLSMSVVVSAATPWPSVEEALSLEAADWGAESKWWFDLTAAELVNEDLIRGLHGGANLTIPQSTRATIEDIAVKQFLTAAEKARFWAVQQALWEEQVTIYVFLYSDNLDDVTLGPRGRFSRAVLETSSGQRVVGEITDSDWDYTDFRDWRGSATVRVNRRLDDGTRLFEEHVEWVRLYLMGTQRVYFEWRFD